MPQAPQLSLSMKALTHAPSIGLFGRDSALTSLALVQVLPRVYVRADATRCCWTSQPGEATTLTFVARDSESRKSPHAAFIGHWIDTACAKTHQPIRAGRPAVVASVGTGSDVSPYR